ncbi:MAG TPA: PAS domain-containing sensor histidine kinase [Candidatus Saccharimonadales bacterium]|nr:PAS domain-containing sensor histidine kinase [Candidatus Saccharimonadales bacterium]
MTAGRPSPTSQTAAEQRTETAALFNSIGDGAIATDEFGRITRVNPRALQILGYSATDLVGEWFPRKIVALSSQSQFINLIDRPITRAFLTGRTVAEKMYYRRKDGSSVPVAITVSPMLLNGRPLGAIEVFRDITLEEEIDRMKSEFISLASHQLRTPLSSIKTYSHMLIDGYMGPLTPEQKRSLRTIIGATNRMNELISTLLNITRIESGTIAVAPKSVRVDKLAEEVIKELSLMASERSINLTLERRGRGNPAIKTDSLILKEIMVNLVSNAIKYTPEQGKVRLIVRPRTKDVQVEVIDTGWGIPKQDQEQIFSKFFRAPNIVKRETTGTGLGLYMVKGLLEELGGDISFNSEEGQGTHFVFTLPRTRSQAVTEQEAEV